MEEIQVFDKPLVKTQRFEVSIPDQMGRITVIRKEVIRQTYQMGCTDGLPDDYVDKQVSYEIHRECDPSDMQRAIQAVEDSLKVPR